MTGDHVINHGMDEFAEGVSKGDFDARLGSGTGLYQARLRSSAVPRVLPIVKV